MYGSEFEIREQKNIHQLTIKLNRNIYLTWHIYKIVTHRTLKFSFLSVDAAKDFIPPEVVELLQKSTNTLMQELFRFQENQDKGDGKFEVSFLFLKGKHLLRPFKHMSQSIFHVTLKV